MKLRKVLSTLGIVMVVAALLVLGIPGIALASPATASRDLPATVEPGDEFNVAITASDYGLMGQVVETLPAGFSYVSSSLDASQVHVTGDVVEFVLIGEESFTYAVTAATVEDTYTFSGIIKDSDLNEFTVLGDTGITVVEIPDGIIAISVAPTEIDFGIVHLGETSDPVAVTIVNIGTAAIELDALLDPAGTVFENLKLDDVAYNSWEVDLAIGASDVFDVVLKVPADYTPGEEEATLIFEATAS